MDAVLRVVIVYVFVLVGLRVVGKREFAQLTPLEVVTLMLIPEMVSQALQRDDASLIDGLVGVATILALTYLTSLLQQGVKRFSTVLTSSPAVLAAHGRLVEEALNAERVEPDEVLAAAHLAGLERLGQVRWAILESDGRITIVPERDVQKASQEAPATDAGSVV